MKRSGFSSSGSDALTLEGMLTRIAVLAERVDVSTVKNPGELELETVLQSKYELEGMVDRSQEYISLPKLSKKVVKDANKLIRRISTYEKSLVKQVDSEYRSIKCSLFLSEHMPTLSAKRRERKFGEKRERWHYLEDLRQRVTGENIYLDSGIYVGLSLMESKSRDKALSRSVYLRAARTLGISGAVLVAVMLGDVDNDVVELQAKERAVSDFNKGVYELTDRLENYDNILQTESLVRPVDSMGTHAQELMLKDDEGYLSMLEAKDKVVNFSNNQSEIYSLLLAKVNETISDLEPYRGKILSVDEYRDFLDIHMMLDVYSSISLEIFPIMPEKVEELNELIDGHRQGTDLDRLSRDDELVANIVDGLGYLRNTKIQRQARFFDTYEYHQRYHSASH